MKDGKPISAAAGLLVGSSRFTFEEASLGPVPSDDDHNDDHDDGDA